MLFRSRPNEVTKVHIDKNKNKGFTLVELVIVVAILAILVGILAPAYSKYVERSAESTDLENVRTAYGEVMIAVEIEEEKDVLKVVPLKQKKAGWQSSNTVSIAGISHSNGDPDTDHWKGDPVAGGVCEVSYDPKKGILFDWKGKNEDSIPSFNFPLYNVFTRSNPDSLYQKFFVFSNSCSL